MYDIIIIGGGPAGVSAALYAKAGGFNILLIEKDEIGGLIKNVSTVSHYVGISENESGQTFKEKMKKQVENAGIVVKYEEVTGLDLKYQTKKVRTRENIYSSRAVIIAQGTVPKDLGLANEKEVGVEHSVFGLKEDIEDRIVFVAGGGDGAAKEALYLSNIAKKVYLIEEKDELMMIDEFKNKIMETDNIEALTSSKIVSIEGSKDKITEVCIYDSWEDEEKIFDTGEDEFIVFAFNGQYPNTVMYQGKLDLEDGYIWTDGVKTSEEGVFACGDIIAKKKRQIATAVSEGCMAAFEAEKYLGYGLDN